MKAGAKLLIPFGIFLTAGALFAQKINAQAVDKVLRSNSSIARQLPLSENAISSVKIVETKNSQEVWVDGRMGRVKLTTFPKGANVEFAMLSASGSGAMLN